MPGVALRRTFTTFRLHQIPTLPVPLGQLLILMLYPLIALECLWIQK